MNLINSSNLILRVLGCAAPLFELMPRRVLKLRFWRKAGKVPNTRNPKDLQEYIFARYFDAIKDSKKLSTLSRLTDKLAVRNYVAEHIGEQYLTRLYGAWENADDIDFSTLPKGIAIKTNNGCGTNLIIRDRSKINLSEIRKRLNSWMKYPYGALSGQPHYSGIKPMIIAEELLVQNEGTDDLPLDYKFFCFKGEPQFILFYSGRKINGHITNNLLYDTNWKKIEGAVRLPQDKDEPQPEPLAEMVELARKLSQDFDIVRVDFYAIGKRVVFGELTFTPDIWTNFTPEFLKSAMQYTK